MSTLDVPGAVAANHDSLALGCWAEHEDESLVFVMANEVGRVVYSIFDLERKLEYRDAMPESTFKREFSWNQSGASRSLDVKWTWHDKTPFPWQRVIDAAIPDGVKVPSASHAISAAQRVADHLKLRAERLRSDKFSHMAPRVRNRFTAVREKIGRAIGELRK